MILAEEYLKRYGLRCPLIKRPNQKLHLIWRTDPKKYGRSFMLLSIGIMTEAHRPSAFNVSWLIPQHNAIISGNNFLASFNDRGGAGKRVEWDEYEAEVLHTITQPDESKTPVEDLSEAKLAVWQMFLYGINVKICEFPAKIKNDVFTSIMNADFDIRARMQAHERVVEYWNEVRDSNLRNGWQQLHHYYNPKTYGDWLARLTMQMRDAEFRKEFADLVNVA